MSVFKRPAGSPASATPCSHFLPFLGAAAAFFGFAAALALGAAAFLAGAALAGFAAGGAAAGAFASSFGAALGAAALALGAAFGLATLAALGAVAFFAGAWQGRCRGARAKEAPSQTSCTRRPRAADSHARTFAAAFLGAIKQT